MTNMHHFHWHKKFQGKVIKHEVRWNFMHTFISRVSGHGVAKRTKITVQVSSKLQKIKKAIFSESQSIFCKKPASRNGIKAAQR